MSRSFISLILLILGTVITLLWPKIDAQILHFISACYAFLMHGLHAFIYDHLIRQMIVVVGVSLLLALIPAFIYWIVKRNWLHEYMMFAWSIWLVLVTMIVVKHGI